MAHDPHGLEILERAECFRLLDSVPVGRLGLSIDALPVVLPVNFVVHGERIVIGTGQGGKFDAAVRGAVVAFEADDWDPFAHRGWSVLVRGSSRILRDPVEVAAARSLPLRPWGDPDGVHYLSITTDLVSGRRLLGPSAPRHRPHGEGSTAVRLP